MVDKDYGPLVHDRIDLIYIDFLRLSFFFFGPNHFSWDLFNGFTFPTPENLTYFYSSQMVCSGLGYVVKSAWISRRLEHLTYRLPSKSGIGRGRGICYWPACKSVLLPKSVDEFKSMLCFYLRFKNSLTKWRRYLIFFLINISISLQYSYVFTCVYFWNMTTISNLLHVNLHLVYFVHAFCLKIS